MSEEPAIPAGLALLPTEGAAASPSMLRDIWQKLDIDTVGVLATLVFLLLGGFGTRIGIPAQVAPWFFVGAYLAGGWHGTMHGIRSLLAGSIDVDLLMILAALGAAYVRHAFEGAMLLFLFSLSHTLQELAIERSRTAITALMKLRPEIALCKRGNETKTLRIEELVVGDIVVVRPGESIPVDGIVVEGTSTVNQSSITGESMPVDKKAGDKLFAGTMNEHGGMEMRATKPATESTLAKLVQLVEKAQAQKATSQRFLERAEKFYAVGVIAFTLALIAVPIWFFGQAFAPTFYRAMTVMVVASPCALVISTPASILSAIANAARRGVLFKGGVYLEKAAEIDIVAFDKTGTLTEGRPVVTDLHVIAKPGRSAADDACLQEELLWLAAAIESRSEHPVARAVVAEAKRRFMPIERCTRFQSVAGHGVSATVCGRRIAVGNLKYFDGYESPERTALEVEMDRMQDAGKTGMLVGEILGEETQPTVRYLGFIAVADKMRGGSSAGHRRASPERRQADRHALRRRRARRGRNGARLWHRGGPRRSSATGQGSRHPAAKKGGPYGHGRRRGQRRARARHRGRRHCHGCRRNRCGHGNRRCGVDERRARQRDLYARA